MNETEINEINQQLLGVQWDNNFNLSFDHIDEDNRLLCDVTPHIYMKKKKRKRIDGTKIKSRAWSQSLLYLFVSFFSSES